VIVPYPRLRADAALDPGAAHGEQAAIGQDPLDLMTVLDRARLCWRAATGRRACTQVLSRPSGRALVTTGANAEHGRPSAPADAAQERAFWYQWYFNTERGRAGLSANRRDICRLLWREWSPSWRFDDAYFERTAPAFDNPDFVEVVIHSYRHRHGNAAGDPRFDLVERRLAERSAITVPSMILHGAEDTVDLARRTEAHLALFPAGTERRVVPGAGHFLPHEKPAAVAEAILQLSARGR
jgi:pimeloyl-ACP methyl ester carboxylesterase